ncbi:L-aspartate decarboxylase [Podosphaera aphanis]|nr:L-aspartate decarboxylase [Podosphaera aphanis]
MMMSFKNNSVGEGNFVNSNSNNNNNNNKQSDELDDLLKAVQSLIIPFIKSAEHDDPTSTSTGLLDSNGAPRNSLVEAYSPQELLSIMKFNLPDNGQGKNGLLSTIEQVLKYSINSWGQGFMDKLYAGTNPVGVISELILGILNTNVHVYHVSPALTLIEKTTTKNLASLFGFDGPHAGGISTQGGSASNTTSIIIARNTLYPSSKKLGNMSHKFVLFTSTHGHYSLEKAAQICGLGTDNVWAVPVDMQGRMIPSELEKLVLKAKDEGRSPFYVNATAGTTVLGAYDPIGEISPICKKYNLWLHVDACWGGPVAFSKKQKYKMSGSHLADSLAVNPHKMMGVPVTCSFLLSPDLRKFHASNTLPAGYLFHSDLPSEEVWDLADLTLQCGRRPDSLKLALAWIYYGKDGFEQQVDHAFSIASYFASQVQANPAFHLTSENPPPCLQVCFYYTGKSELKADEERNRKITSHIADALVPKGFMVDYAPGMSGPFLRVVVNRNSRKSTIDSLIKAIEEIGSEYETNYS